MIQLKKVALLQLSLHSNELLQHIYDKLIREATVQCIHLTVLPDAPNPKSSDTSLVCNTAKQPLVHGSSTEGEDVCATYRNSIEP